jgi:hypothetical protein
LRRIQIPTEHVKAIQRQLLMHPFCDSPKGLGTHQALNKFLENIKQGFQWVASIDIRDCFSNINARKTLGMIDTRIAEGVPGLYGWHSLPQGHPISSCLAEVYLSQFDRMAESWQAPTLLSDNSTTECRVIRYVDNIWLMCRKRRMLEFYLSLSLDYLSGLGLTPRVESFRHVNQGTDILGYTVTKWSTGPNARNIQRFKDRCMRYALERKQLEAKLSSADRAESTEDLKACIRYMDWKFCEFHVGWENYFGPAMRSWLHNFLLGLNTWTHPTRTHPTPAARTSVWSTQQQ